LWPWLILASIGLLVIFGAAKYAGALLVGAGGGAFLGMMIALGALGKLGVEVCGDCFNITPVFFVFAILGGVLLVMAGVVVDSLLHRRAHEGIVQGAGIAGAVLGSLSSLALALFGS